MKIRNVIFVIIFAFVTLLPSVAQKAVVITVSGDKYAGFDCSSVPFGFEKRSENPNFYVTLPLYSDPLGTIPVYVDEAGTVQKKVKLPRKHIQAFPNGTIGSTETEIFVGPHMIDDAYSTSSPAEKIVNPENFLSIRFVVSPVDVYNDGSVTYNPKSPVLGGGANSNSMDWATACSMLEAANTVGYNTVSSAVTRGCYMYKGKSGTDAEGSWRPPTVKEMALIMSYMKYLVRTSPDTGFTSFSVNQYVTCTEAKATQTSGSSHKNFAALQVLKYSDKTNMEYQFKGGSNAASPKNNAIYRLRCIRDVD